MRSALHMCKPCGTLAHICRDAPGVPSDVHSHRPLGALLLQARCTCMFSPEHVHTRAQSHCDPCTCVLRRPEFHVHAQLTGACTCPDLRTPHTLTCSCSRMFQLQRHVHMLRSATCKVGVHTCTNVGVQGCAGLCSGSQKCACHSFTQAYPLLRPTVTHTYMFTVTKTCTHILKGMSPGTSMHAHSHRGALRQPPCAQTWELHACTLVFRLTDLHPSPTGP